MNIDININQIDEFENFDEDLSNTNLPVTTGKNDITSSNDPDPNPKLSRAELRKRLKSKINDHQKSRTAGYNREMMQNLSNLTQNQDVSKILNDLSNSENIGQYINQLPLDSRSKNVSNIDTQKLQQAIRQLNRKK